MDREKIKLVQSELNKRYGTSLVVDGLLGPKTDAALMKVETLPSDWPRERKVVGFIQHVATVEGINAGPIDGKWGPQTDYGHEQLVHKLKTGDTDNWRDAILDAITPDTTSSSKWPLQDQDSMTAFFGEPGTNQGKCNSPYPLKLAWDTDTVINRFTCHEKIAPIVERILEKVLDHYGIEKIRELRLDLWGGALNVRKMRGSKTRWSTHSWGTSIDWDPANNRLKWGRDKATLAGPEYDFWWKCWEEEGAVSLGREQNRDWMHVQFARLK